MSYVPVIIIGAPRSGTNMLRDVLCNLSDFGTWPCDEINYIWRHGNVKSNSDELVIEDARPDVVKYIRSCFDKEAYKLGKKFLVEKTCANSLRVPFVAKVLPDAKYVFIYRNGIDALVSAQHRWVAELDIPYLIKKVKYVPLTDLPYYANRYLLNRLYRVFSRDKRLAFWGPQLSNMQALLEEYDLQQVCALQWKSCVDASEEAFTKMSKDKVVRVSYENFVAQPDSELSRILAELKIEVDKDQLDSAVSNVRRSSVGKGSKQLDNATAERILPLIVSSLKRYGY